MSSKHVPSEESQLAILASDASLHDKAGACQRLVYVAGPRSVAPLAALLDDEVLSDYARSGLEAIEDESASQALIDALPKLKGRLLAGAVNSLGVRREEKAIPALQKLVDDPASGVQAEAIASLGLIGTPDVAPILVPVVEGDSELKIPAGHAMLVAVERLLSGESAETGRKLTKVLVTNFSEGPIHDAAKRL